MGNSNFTKITEAFESLEQFNMFLRRNTETYSFGNYEECRELFEEAFKATDSTVEKFVFLPEYDEVVKWMTDTNGKGLLLSGACGIGKSIIITGVVPVIFKMKFNKVIRPISSIDMLNQEEEVKSRHFICIDEVGSEATQVSFGEHREVFGEIVENAEARLKPLFVSTNLTGRQIGERYGDRVRSRLNRLCKCIVFKSETDLRNLSSLKNN